MPAYHRAKARGRLIQPKSGAKLAAKIAQSSDAFTEFMAETFVVDAKGTVTYTTAYEALKCWCGKHGRTDLLERIIPQNLKKHVRNVPDYQHVDNAPRPHGTPRRLLGIRFRNRGDREKEWEEA